MPSELARAHTRTYSGAKSAEFAHDWHQVMVCETGAFSVRDDTGSWTVPAGSAAWVPSRFRHAVEPLPRARVLTIYLHRDRARHTRPACGVLALTPLARAIADHVSRLGALGGTDVAAKRLFAVLIDELGGLGERALFVPALTTALTQRVADLLAADPSGTPRISDVAAAIGVSGRTLERAFVAETAMTIGEWRQRSRVCRAIHLLAGGMAVKEVALEVGYETPSAFVTAFKRYVGTTPGKIG